MVASTVYKDTTKPKIIEPVVKQTPVKVAPALPIASTGTVTYTPIETFGWDQSNKFISIYLSKDLEGIEEAKVTSSFGKDWFDLKIIDLRGRNFRLKKEGLDNDIVPGKSKHKVSARNNMVTIKLRKTEGEYGPTHWSYLTPKFKKSKTDPANPTAGIMDMMQQMYNEGDDTMKATIGKAMMEARNKKGFS